MKRVLVTGASRGIGKEIATGLCDQGYQIIAVSRNLSGSDSRFINIEGDISNLEFIDQLASRVIQDFGHIDVLINAAGIFDVAKFKEYFKTNPEAAQYIAEKEKDAELNAKFQIYNTLIKAGLYTTASEGKLKYEAEANKVNFSFAAALYSSIKDSEVKISDAEIVDFMKKNVNMSEQFINFEVHRYFGWPGQAPSYKIGQRIWENIRDEYKARQGANFNIKEFHMKALNLGSVGLDTLETALLG